MIRAPVVLTLAFLVAACDPYPPRHHLAAWRTEGASPPGALRVPGLVAEHAPCDLGDWGGVLAFVPPADLTPDAGLATWYPSDVPRAWVAWDGQAPVSATAAAHEVEHMAQVCCGLTPAHDAEFAARVAAVNAELESEGL